ncbi:MAG: hypothetical protein KDA29_07455 [Phycisphaerales bacterium]|nr:hypothetical protein [Phycisphaerales bacterium]
MLKTITIAMTTSTLLMLSGCSESSSSPQAQAPSNENTTETTPYAWVLTSAPAGDVSITEAKANAKEGDQIVIRGRIGGRHEPISADSPVFTIVDLGLEYCGQTTDDQCGTPWDYCCETPSTIASNSATVQVQGDEIDLTGAGLKPLDEVVLIGTVGPRPDEQVLTIRATGVYPVGG